MKPKLWPLDLELGETLASGGLRKQVRMRKILILASVVAITMAALHSEAAGAPICRSAHTAASIAQQTLPPEPALKSTLFLKTFNDAMDLRAYNAIWAQTTKEMQKEIAHLPKEDQEQIQQAAKSIQEYMHSMMVSSFKWKKWNRTKEHSNVYKFRSRMEELKEDLRIGNNAQIYGTHGYAVSIYKVLFHDVESSYLKLKSNLAEMSMIEKYGRTAEEIRKQNSLKKVIGETISEKIRTPKAMTRLEQLRRENRKQFQVLGRGLEEYLMVRLYLENVAKEDPILMSDPAFVEKGRHTDQLSSTKEIADYARDILTQLGVSGTDQISPFLGLPRERIPLDDIYEMYVRTPEIQIEQIKEDYVSNRGLFFRSNAVNNIFVNYIRKTIDLLPNHGKLKFMRQVLGIFTKFIERRHLELRYLNQIQDIIYAETDIGAQFSILRRQNDFSDLPDEFLITFARVSYYSKQWSDLRKFSEQIAAETGSQVDADFVERMKKAEVEAVQAGTFSPGKADTKGTIVKDSYSLITTSLLVYNYDHIWNGILSFSGVVTETAKFVCKDCGF